MPTFIAYNYSFEPTPSNEAVEIIIDFPEFANSQISRNISKESLNDIFYRGFEEAWNTSEKKLNLYSTKKNKDKTEEPEMYENNIVAIHERVILMVIRNHKVVRFTPKDNTEKQDIDDYPWCYVIIDTRPHSQHILIEKKKEAFNSPKTVCDIFENYIMTSMSLPQIGWECQCRKRVIEDEIWRIVDSRLKYKKDRVKSLGFHFYKRENNENDNVEVALQSILSAFSTAEGDITMYNEDSSGKSFDHRNETMRRTVEMLIRNDYTIKVGFDKTGSIEYGRQRIAIPEYLFDSQVLSEYRDQPNLGSNGTGSYELIEEIDGILTEETKVQYQQIKEKKGGRRKKSKSNQRA